MGIRKEGIGLFVIGSALVYTVVPRIQDRVDNWLDPFAVDALVEAMRTSLEIAAVSTLIATVLGSMIALDDPRDEREPRAGRPVVDELMSVEPVDHGEHVRGDAIELARVHRCGRGRSQRVDDRGVPGGHLFAHRFGEHG